MSSLWVKPKRQQGSGCAPISFCRAAERASCSGKVTSMGKPAKGWPAAQLNTLPQERSYKNTDYSSLPGRQIPTTTMSISLGIQRMSSILSISHKALTLLLFILSISLPSGVGTSVPKHPGSEKGCNTSLVTQLCLNCFSNIVLSADSFVFSIKAFQSISKVWWQYCQARWFMQRCFPTFSQTKFNVVVIAGFPTTYSKHTH